MDPQDVAVFEKVRPCVQKLIDRLSQVMCFWCCSRHIGIDKISFYKLDYQEGLTMLCSVYSLKRPENFSRFHKQEGGSVCNACYGILTHYTDDVFVKNVCAAVDDSKIEYENFLCAVAVPVASIIRELSFLLVCADECPDAYQYMSLESMISVKDAWKWKCGGAISRSLGKRVQPNHLDITIEFTQSEVEKETSGLTSKFPDQFRKRKGQGTETYTHKSVKDALTSVSRDKLRKLIPVPPPVLTERAACKEINCFHQPVYVAGRYNKYSRELPQSPWTIDGVKKGESSVSELISTPLLKYTQASGENFSSSGREDIDVKMLGNGRPFMIQLISPRRLLTPQVLCKLQTEINQSTKHISISRLQIVSREQTQELKELETEKRKLYRALCESETEISQEDLDVLSNINDLVLEQLTPIRVLHRRALASRQRSIHWMSAKLEPGSKHLFSIDMETESGTYVKEFVHSDFGRTKPSLGTILNNRTLDILQLDVLNVDVDWPKEIPDDNDIVDGQDS